MLLVAIASAPAHAQQRDEDAKAAYAAGKSAYEAKHFEEALDRFKRSYVLSGQPALLYNIASTLQQLNRPGDAADTLRDFVKARPTDPDRPEIEKRISDLVQAQQLLDRDKAEKDRLVAEQEARHARERAARLAADEGLRVVPGWLTESEADRRLTLLRQHEKKRRRTLAIGLGVGFGLLLVGGAVAGAVCGTGHCTPSPPRDYDFVTVAK